MHWLFLSFLGLLLPHLTKQFHAILPADITIKLHRKLMEMAKPGNQEWRKTFNKVCID